MRELRIEKKINKTSGNKDKNKQFSQLFFDSIYILNAGKSRGRKIQLRKGVRVKRSAIVLSMSCDSNKDEEEKGVKIRRC
jgi:hypothetical protein